MPVFAKAGAIIPMSAAEILPDENPETIILNVFPGADNSFILYEDDNLTEGYLKGRYAKTKFTLDWAKRTFDIKIINDEAGIIPINRNYKIILNCVEDSDVSVNGNYEKYYENNAVVILTDSRDDVQIKYDRALNVIENDYAKCIHEILYRAQTEYEIKSKIMRLVETKSKFEFISDISVMEIDKNLKSAILEKIL